MASIPLKPVSMQPSADASAARPAKGRAGDTPFSAILEQQSGKPAMTTSEELATYESISAVTTAMLDAARTRDWQRLVALEQDAQALVGQLSDAAPLPSPDDATRSRKIELIQKVLSDDAAIRDITEPWLREVGDMLRSNRRESALRQSYGDPMRN